MLQGTPLSVPAVAHPPAPDLKVLGGGKGEVKPRVQHATQRSADSGFSYPYLYICSTPTWNARRSRALHLANMPSNLSQEPRRLREPRAVDALISLLLKRLR